MAKNKFYRFPLYLLVRFWAAVVCVLPRSWALVLGRRIGRFGFYCVRRHREKALLHLRMAFGHEKSEEEIRELAQKVFEHMVQTAVDILQFPKLNQKKVARMVDPGNAFKMYDEILGEGKGLISLTAHLGNWELLAGIFALKGYKGAVLARRIYYDRYDRWILSLRKSIGIPLTIYRDESAKKILTLLRHNQIIGMLPDQDTDSLKGIFVPFFGRPAYTTEAPVRIALATGAPIVTNFLIREKGDRYRVVVRDVIRPVVETTRQEAIQKYTEQWMYSFESMIRQYPEQWAWMHPRWKTQPEPEVKNLCRMAV
ncbi:MAG: lysophospholipid acyltransferase family protein [Candidatus Omnitrophica bacterium]|nr:lysophospholipid acyltransferase family protein [Candidatus Omnitrophota bacterium]